MKQSTTSNYPSDEIIEGLYYSSNPADWKIASIWVIEKYKYQPAINSYFEKISRGYRIRKAKDIAGELTTQSVKVHIYVDKEAWLQIIIGSYGLWCKSLARYPILARNTIIEDL